MKETSIVHRILPQEALQAVQADADALAECPNYWVPMDVVEGRAPALAAAEQVVQHLYRRLVKARLDPHDVRSGGAEFWCQIYEGGRGLGFHFDKDEHAMKQHGRMANPILSSVLYLTGAPEDAGAEVAADAGTALRQAPTVLIDQWFDHDQCCVLPEHPAWSALVFPRVNQYCLFSGKQAHGVLESMAAPQQQQHQQQQQQGCGHQGRPVQRRVTFLVNWWAQQPQGIKRATREDVREGKLAPAADGLGCGPHLSTVDSSSHSSSCNAAAGDPSLASLSLEDAPQSTAAGAGSRQEAALGVVEFVRIEAPALAPGSVLPLDDLLREQPGLELAGPGAVDALVVSHPGLTLVPLDEEAVDPTHPLQVLAALVPTHDLESGSSSDSGSEGRDGGEY
ncbi:hypothetical protein ABPG77_003772 [Micractinium sp. CCAP 211/92]